MWPLNVFRRKAAGIETKTAISAASPDAQRQWAMAVGMHSISGAPDTVQARIQAVECNPIAFWCVRKISWAAATVPWFVEGPGGNPDSTHYVNALLKQPNAKQSAWEFFQLIASSLATTGNAYVSKISSALDENKTAALIFLRPDRVTPIYGSNSAVIIEYQYNGPGGVQTFRPDDICHIRHAWLSHDVEGLAVIKPAWEPASLYAGLMKLARKILENAGGIPGLLVFSSEKGMSDKQRDNMQEHINRFRVDGDKFGQILLSDIPDKGDVKFIGLAGDMEKLQPDKTRTKAATDIMLLYGVPPILASVGEGSTFNNMSEAQRSFWLDTVVPGYVQPIADALSMFLGVKIAPDLSEVPALSAFRADLVGALAQANWLSLDEKRNAMGFKPVMFGNRIMQPIGQQPFDTQVVSSDAMAISSHDPALLQSIVAAAAQEAIKSYVDALRAKDGGNLREVPRIAA
jgi:HK97 family phage portal protein